MKRKELREAAVKLFYEMDIQKTFEHKFYKIFLAENELIALNTYKMILKGSLN